MTSSSAAPARSSKICFNPLCKDPKSDSARRRGWRLRSGDYAELCDRCYFTYEQGSFCETFHSDAAGWRNCEACAKRVHCGCIISAHAYVLLDAGGVDCIACARKSFAMAPSQMWSSSLPLPQQISERKDTHVKNWKSPTAPFPGYWRQAANLWNASSVQSDLQQRLAYEFDRPNNGEKLFQVYRSSVAAQEKKYEDPSERITSNSLKQIVRERFANGNISLDPSFSYTISHREGNPKGLQDPNNLAGETDTMSLRKGVIVDPCLTTSSGANLDRHPNSAASSLPSSILDEDSSSSIGLATAFSSLDGAKDSIRIASTQMQRQGALPSISKQIYSHNAADSEMQAQVSNGRPRLDAQTRAQLLPRYWPRITNQELQQISGDSKSVITPLFEKMLSASDAGKIGRLVLPKKCAEAYFPIISQPEGLPLKVQDASGKDWVFQFRFWPNNNSRMYVLEGVTPCIQSMQLQAGDTVTFSRIDPEGKLVMGFRKASGISSGEQDTQNLKFSNGLLMPLEGNSRNLTEDSNPNIPLCPTKESMESRYPANPAEKATSSKFDKGGFIQKDGLAARSLQGSSKRKGSSLGTSSKRLRIENKDSMELKLTWEEAQQLLRPPPSHVPSTIIIEGHEFEEYEEAPVLGKRTYFIPDKAGDIHQWAQCEDCSKWRKLPEDALLPYRWTCSDNTWDTERSSCSASQELSLEQLAELIPTKTGGSKRSKVKVESQNVGASNGLDTLANLAILGEGEALATTFPQTTTKHPRHRPGCSCIVCIQPPSGKGPKHKQTCTCNVCLTVKRRFKTLMMRREKRQSEKEAEVARKQQEQQQKIINLLPEEVGKRSSLTNSSSSSFPEKTSTNNNGAPHGVPEHRKTTSPFKAEIDLNFQPEQEEEPSPKLDARGMMRLLRDTPT
ncbi:B3 domain-containing protein Os07g0563300-like [Typha latifolia]|uniref:B3 domain-containing protein Os07g0563300-like n=1 Tax=Typha latifolia TaxID=4733 RepID=UPI003C2AF372